MNRFKSEEGETETGKHNDTIQITRFTCDCGSAESELG